VLFRSYECPGNQIQQYSLLNDPIVPKIERPVFIARPENQNQTHNSPY